MRFLPWSCSFITKDVYSKPYFILNNDSSSVLEHQRLLVPLILLTDISLNKRFIVILETFNKPYHLKIGVRALILLFVEIIVFIESGTKIHGIFCT